MYILDITSKGSSARIYMDAISSRGGRYTSILTIEFPRTDCKTDIVMSYNKITFGEKYKMGPKGPLQIAKPEDHDYSANFL